MFQRIRKYQPIYMDGQSYRPRAFGDPQPDGTWDGWLVFFPMEAGSAVASDREATQSTFDGLVVWATGLTPEYLEGVLARALVIAQQPSVIDRLSVAEYEPLDDEDRLETTVGVRRSARKKYP